MTAARRKNPRKARRQRSLARRSLGHYLRIAPFVVPIILTAFIYAWLHTRINIVTLPIESLRSKKRDLVKYNDSVRVSIERLQAPERIESIARKKLGMVSPQKWQVVALDGPLRPSVEAEKSKEPGSFTPGRKWAGLIGFLGKRGILGRIFTSTLPEAAGRPG